MNGGSPRELIIRVLRKHPEGLTITAISELTKLHRHTVTKYLYELRGAGVINEREIGPAKLCYLRDGFTKKKERGMLERLNGNRMKSSLGQTQILAIVLFLVLIPAAIITAQNATNFTQNISIPIEGYLTGLNDSPAPNQTGLIKDIISNETSNETNESEIGFEINVSLNITDDVSLNITDDVIINETNNETNESVGNESVGNETYSEPPNMTINETDSNATFEINETNETYTEPPIVINETVNETEPIEEPEINETLNETEGTEVILDVEIISPEHVSRNESLEIKAFAENTGSVTAKNVRIEWILPEGFEILSGDGSAYCEELVPESSCWNNITAAVSLTSQIGKNDIKVMVSYEG